MIQWPRRATGAQQTIHSRRLRLIPVTPHSLQAEEKGLQQLRKVLGARVPEDWPPEHWGRLVRTHIVAQCAAHPETIGWHRYALLESPPRILIGCLGAFPCAPGDVEIGYSVVPSFQRQGYGSEAAAAFVQWLLAQASIHSVSAQTFETQPESVKVMLHCGMHFIGAGDEPGTVRYRRFR